MLRDILQGKPMGQALHPFLVHFPLALFGLSFLLDLASLVFKPAPALVAAAFYSLGTGLVLALVAAVPGFIDYIDIRRDHKAKRIATYHMLLNLMAVALYGLNLGLRAGSVRAASTPMLALIVSLVCLGILTLSGYLGGSMVYDHGVGVGRHRRRTATPEEIIHLEIERKPNAPEPEFVPVAAAMRLKDGETLLVELEGQMIVIARVHGDFCAFQEFCTHRFGPLSEGSFTDGEVQCPWHRSCFNVRTGSVVTGPAKEPIKTWPTRVEGETLLLGCKPRPLALALPEPKEAPRQPPQPKPGSVRRP